MNILVTSFLMLLNGNQYEVIVGLSCHESLSKLDLNTAKVFLRKSSVGSYNSNIEQEEEEEAGVHNCRQLMSTFDDCSTYFPYRASLFSNPLMMPITTFTLHLVPLNGYGFSRTNAARLISQLFSMFAKCLATNQNVTTEDIQFLKEKAVGNSKLVNDILNSLKEITITKAIMKLSTFSNPKAVQVV